MLIIHSNAHETAIIHSFFLKTVLYRVWGTFRTSNIDFLISAYKIYEHIFFVFERHTSCEVDLLTLIHFAVICFFLISINFLIIHTYLIWFHFFLTFFLFVSDGWTHASVQRTIGEFFEGSKSSAVVMNAFISLCVWYDLIWYDMVCHVMRWYDKIWCDMMWYDIIWYDIIRYNVI